jgi:hypothetical protein
MALDPNIALGVRGIELPNQLAQYGQIAQIQNAQNQNALAQFQLGSAQRAETKDIARTNALAAAGSDDAAIANALLKSGDLKGYSEFLKSRRETMKSDVDLADAKLKQSRQFLENVSTPEQYIAWHEANHKDPILGPMLAARGVTTEQSRARINEAIQAGPQAFATLINQSKLGTEKFMELNKPSNLTVNQGGQTQVLQTPGLGGAPVSMGTYADVPLPAPVEQQKIRIGLASRPTQNVYLPPQEKAEQGDRGKMLVKQYEGISESARLGARSLPALQANATILDKGFDTGFGTEAKAAGAKVLGALGVKDAENYATDAQSFLGNASAAVLQKQLEQKGAQTEFDAQRITQTGAQLGNTKQANKFFIDVAKEQIQRDIEQRNFYDKWWKSNKTYDGAEDAWYSSEGGKSLFERPSLKKYTAPTRANAGAATVDNRAAGLDAIFNPKK